MLEGQIWLFTCKDSEIHPVVLLLLSGWAACLFYIFLTRLDMAFGQTYERRPSIVVQLKHMFTILTPLVNSKNNPEHGPSLNRLEVEIWQFWFLRGETSNASVGVSMLSKIWFYFKKRQMSVFAFFTLTYLETSPFDCSLNIFWGNSVVKGTQKKHLFALLHM